ncbi:MAG: MerR family transcriptional regulator [Candidatus Gastranaerophilaceae bacterium]
MLIDKDKPFYSVVQVAEILGISADRLRTYDEQKLVFPTRRINDNKRLYSELDIEWLKDIRDLISKNRMNIYSFKLVWKMLLAMSKKDFQKFVAQNKDDEVIQILARIKNNPNFVKKIL